MTSNEPIPQTRSTVFDRVAGTVGDLDHPMYDDEHLRDVWNEASAIGYQALCWLLLVGATVAVWVGGPTSTPYVLVAMIGLGLVGMLMMGYAARRGVDIWSTPGTGTVRWVLVGVLGVVLVVGLVRNVGIGPDLPEIAGGVIGGIVGGGGALLLMILALRAARRRAPAGEDD